MSDATRTVILEREFRHSREKLWRALTESSLLAEWLLANDFAPSVGTAFQFRAEPMPHWNGVIECKVLVIEPLERLSYTWNALGLESVVLFTLAATDAGTLLRMEQSGFRADQDAAFKGATYGWQRFLGKLEQILDGGVA